MKKIFRGLERPTVNVDGKTGVVDISYKDVLETVYLDQGGVIELTTYCGSITICRENSGVITINGITITGI